MNLGIRRARDTVPGMALRRTQIAKTWDYQSIRHHGKSARIEWKGHEHWLSAGSRDSISFYAEGDTLYVLSVNQGLGYVGLEVFTPDGKLGDVFMQSDTDIESAFGKKGLDLSEATMVKRLAEYVY